MTDCEGLRYCNDMWEISVEEGKGNPGAHRTVSWNNKEFFLKMKKKYLWNQSPLLTETFKNNLIWKNLLKKTWINLNDYGFVNSRNCCCLTGFWLIKTADSYGSTEKHSHEDWHMSIEAGNPSKRHLLFPRILQSVSKIRIESDRCIWILFCGWILFNAWGLLLLTHLLDNRWVQGQELTPGLRIT